MASKDGTVAGSYKVHLNVAGNKVAQASRLLNVRIVDACHQ